MHRKYVLLRAMPQLACMSMHTMHGDRTFSHNQTVYAFPPPFQCVLLTPHWSEERP